MFIAFFESMKYMGHIWPIALLRVSLGYFFLHGALEKIRGGFLNDTVLQDVVQRWFAEGIKPETVNFLQTWVLPHWQVFNFAVVICQLLVGICYILGFMVRPAAIIAILLNTAFIVAGDGQALLAHQLLIGLHLMLYLIAAGRCFGFDYYFYKRVRGIWW